MRHTLSQCNIPDLRRNSSYITLFISTFSPSMPHVSIIMRTIFLLFATIWNLSIGDTVSACRISATAICNGGDFPNEIQWKIADTSGNVLVDGKGGESKSFCLSKGGTYTVYGSDTDGDGWNNGFLKVVAATSGKVYFGPWSGPYFYNTIAEVKTWFNVPCQAGTYEYKAISEGGEFPQQIRWRIADPSGNVLVDESEGGESKSFCLSKGGTYTVYGSDTDGDGWNNGFLKVVAATSGKVYFWWDGPKEADFYNEVTASFDVPCQAGTYKYNFACIHCPIGRYGIRAGQNNVNVSCAYKNTTCPAGYFCPGEGGIAAIPCPPGKYGSTTGQTTQAGACPYTCAPGTYGLAGKTNVSNACVVCPAGAYCNGNGTLIPCPLGRYGRANTTYQTNLSFACPHFCQRGKYGLVKGQISSKHACTDCVRGTYGNGIGAATACAHNCPPGKMGILAGAFNQTAACRVCDNGKYQDMPGEKECKECMRGTYTTIDSTKSNCTVCSSNTYQDEIGQSACKVCPSGKFTMPTTLPSSDHHDTKLKCTTQTKCPFEPLRTFYALNVSCYIHKTFFVHGSVQIVGHGNKITITSAGSGRVFDVANGARLMIENVSLSAHRESENKRCEINVPDPDGVVEPVEGVYCNSGGLILRSNATFIAKKSSFSNSWQWKGGSVVYGESNTTVVLESSIFHDNFAFVKGGVLRLESGSRLTIRTCKFYNNQLFNSLFARGKGAVIYGANNVHIVVKDSHFESHGYPGPLGVLLPEYFLYHLYVFGLNGGVLYCGPWCNATFEDSNFHNNRAFAGGVAYLHKSSAIRFRSCTFTQNYARLDGGVVLMQANGHIVFDDCNVSNNTVERFVANDNYGFGNDYSGEGGALHLKAPGSAVISGSLFAHNKARRRGGAIFFQDVRVSLNLSTSSFVHNVADEYGGGIHIGGSKRHLPINHGLENLVGSFFFIQQCQFMHNIAGDVHNIAGDGGGAISININKDHISSRFRICQIARSTFSSNVASKKEGGALSIRNLQGVVKIVNAVFKANYAGLNGGGVYMSSAKVDARSLTFNANRADENGGGMYLTSGENNPSYLRDCKFIQNYASQRGYALAIDNLKLTIVQSMVEANNGSTNTPHKVGGAISVRNLESVFSQSLSVVDTTFTKNIGHYGSSIHHDGPQSTYIRNCTFIENEAKQCGGAIYVTNAATLDITSSKFSNNRAGLDGGAIGIATSSNLVVDGNPKNDVRRKTTLQYNNASRYGGAIYVDDRGALTLSSKYSIQIEYNMALVGGGIYISKSGLAPENFHYSNFPYSNSAKNASNMVSLKGIEKVICKATTYFPLEQIHNGVPIDTWNSEVLSDTFCPKCNDGKTSVEGQTSCYYCPKGKAGIGGFCNDCTINTYQPGIGTTACKQCEEGKFTQKVGSKRCNDAQKPCVPQTPVIYLTYPQGTEKLSLHNATVSWTKYGHADNCHPIADGYTVQIATHRSFTDNLIEYDVKNENRLSLMVLVPIELHNLRLSDVEHFVRVRAYNATTRAKSDWSDVSKGYVSAKTCKSDEYLEISSVYPSSKDKPAKAPWKCKTCFVGATCDTKYNNGTYALLTKFNPGNEQNFIMMGIKAKYGYWRSNVNNSYTFVKCAFEAACLGAPNKDLETMFIDDKNQDPAKKDHPETCNRNAGYREECTFLHANGTEMKGRCRLCTSCTETFRRAYASPRCKACPELHVLWFTIAFLVMLLAFIILLRLGLSRSGRKRYSGQQRRMLVSYMQMNTLLASIGIEWPREMYVLFDIQSAISTVGDHILKIDCMLSNTHPEQLVLYLQAGYALAPFIAALALYLLMPYCRFRLRAKESIKHLHTNKTMFLKAVVLLLYMSYPSLARQSFAFWHCVGIKGRCIHSEDGAVYPDIAKHVCESMDGYTWKGDSDHGYGDYLFMATELQCWDQRHLIYLFTIGLPHVLLYVVGLPLIAYMILLRHRRSGNLENPEILFCYGLLYDGYRNSTWWWQMMIAYTKALIVFISYWWSSTPVMSMLFSNLIFTLLLLAETMLRPWAKSDKKKTDKKMHGRGRQTLAQMLASRVDNVMKETNLSQFSALSIFLCSLTGWSGLYFHLGPDCDSRSRFYICMMITVATIVMHLLFVCWGIVNIFRSKMEEVREASKRKRNDRNNVAKTALRDVPKTKDSAIEISVINPLFQAKGGSQR